MRRSAGPITSACSVVGVMPSSIAVAIGALGHLRVAAFERRGEGLERALDERGRVRAQLFAGVAGRSCRALP